MDDLEEIRKRKLKELKERQQQSPEQNEEQQLQQQFAQMESLVKNYLTKDALERYGNLKVGHSEKAMRVVMVLAQMIQSGQIQSKINDQQLKEILKRLEPKKKDFNIKRK